MSTTNERSQNDIVVGDGVVTVIPYQFNYFEDVNDNIEIVVTKKDTNVDPEEITVLVEGTDYDKYDDRIELASPLLVGELLLVERVVVDVQPYDYQSMRPFPAEVHERQEDRTFMSLSELKNKFKRTPMFNKFNEEEILIEDPIDGNFLKFVYDSDEDKWFISSDQSTIDLSDYYTKSEVDQLQSDQDTALQNYADQAESDAINAAASYTDNREIAIRDDVNNALDDKVDKAGIVAGSNINITGSGSEADPIEISTSGIGEANTMSSRGDGESIALPKDGTDLPVKSLKTEGQDFLKLEATDDTLVSKLLRGQKDQVLTTKIKRAEISDSESAQNITFLPGNFAINKRTGVIIGVTTGSGIAVRSKDGGETWDTPDTGFSFQFESISCSNGRFVMGNSSNGYIIYTEDDGDTWTQLDESGTGTLAYPNVVCCGDEYVLFVSRLYNGYKIYRFGHGWITTSGRVNFPTPGYSWVDASYGDGVFAVTRGNESVLFLDVNKDPLADMTEVTPSLEFLTSITYGNGYWIALASATGVLYRSSNFYTWEDVTPYVTPEPKSKVTFDQGLFFVLPGNSASDTTVHYSILGESWSQSLLENTGSPTEWASAFVVEKSGETPYVRFLGVALSNKSDLSLIAGVEWTNSQKNPVAEFSVRKLNDTGVDGSIPANDAALADAGNILSRRFNHVEGYRADEIGYISPLNDGTIHIIKSGYYRVTATGTSWRTGSTNLGIRALPVGGGHRLVVQSSDLQVPTGATTAGRVVDSVLEGVAYLESGERIRLDHYIENDNGDTVFGAFWTLDGDYNKAARLILEYLGE